MYKLYKYVTHTHMCLCVCVDAHMKRKSEKNEAHIHAQIVVLNTTGKRTLRIAAEKKSTS